MRLTPAHLDTTTAALRAVLPLEHPADSILRRFFRENPKLGAGDRAFIAEAIFGILRHRFFLECLTSTSTPRSLLLAYLAKFQGMNLRELAALVSEAEPQWLIEKLRGFLTDIEILGLGRSLQQPASLDLRVNTLLANRDEILNLLSKDGIEGSITPYSPIGIRLAGKPAINRHELFLSGKVEVQDEGSQLLGYLLAPKR